MILSHQHLDLDGHPVFVKAVVKPPFRHQVPMHNEACFFYIIEGCGDVTTPTDKFSIRARDGVVLKCGNYLSSYVRERNESTCEAIAIHFHKEVLREIYAEELPELYDTITTSTPVRYEYVKASEMLRNYIDNLRFYFDNPELVSDELLKIKIKEIILLLAKTDNIRMIKSLINQLFTPEEVSLKEVIDTHLFEGYSMDELAGLCNLSLSSFKRAFTKHYSTSPARYIKKKKLSKAAHLLRTTELRVSDITYNCGFNDLAHFSKSFHKEYGCAPTDYRLTA